MSRVNTIFPDIMEVNKSMGKSTNLYEDRKVIRCSFLKDILEEFVWKKNESFIAKVDHTRDFDFKVSINYIHYTFIYSLIN